MNQALGGTQHKHHHERLSGGSVVDHDITAAGSLAEPWTGDLILDLRNGRAWNSGSLDIAVHRSSVHVGRGGYTLAVLDRSAFRVWLINPSRPYEADDTIWTNSAGLTCLDLRYAHYRICPESMDLLRAVI
jgi:hypothetical protein